MLLGGGGGFHRGVGAPNARACGEGGGLHRGVGAKNASACGGGGATSWGRGEECSCFTRASSRSCRSAWTPSWHHRGRGRPQLHHQGKQKLEYNSLS